MPQPLRVSGRQGALVGPGVDQSPGAKGFSGVGIDDADWQHGPGDIARYQAGKGVVGDGRQ